MGRYVLIHPRFDGHWPHAARHLRQLWESDGDLVFERFDADDDRAACEAVDDPLDVTRLVALCVPVTERCVERFENLEEAAVYTEGVYGPTPDEEIGAELERRGVATYDNTDTEGYWSQSVAECALGLTICGLRHLPQKHAAITESQDEWDYSPDGTPEPGGRGGQFADDFSHVGGTVAGKNVRTVGVGNIGSRYASACSTLGADVAAHDPYADEPCFHRAGARRVDDVADLVADADVFAPLVPVTEETYHLVDEATVDALPEGALVVLATRARVVDTDALRKRVLADELALAADVFDENPDEPVPLDDPLLGRDNVVHTPHLAGRTEHANEQWARRLAARFDTWDGTGVGL